MPPDPGDDETYDISLDDPAETDEAVRQAVIREVVEHAKRETRAAEMAQPMVSYRGRPLVIGLVAALILSITAHAHLTRAEWLFGPLPEAVPTERREAHLRFAMYLVAGRVVAYQRAQGQLPRSLDQIGEGWPFMTYRVVDSSTFELRGANEPRPPLVYRSNASARAFVGASARQLRTP